MYRNYATSSGKKTATSQITTLPGSVRGMTITPPDACDAVLTVYDSRDGSTSGKLVLDEIVVDAGFSSQVIEYDTPLVVNEGIYAVLTDQSGGDTGSLAYLVRFTVG